MSGQVRSEALPQGPLAHSGPDAAIQMGLAPPLRHLKIRTYIYVMEDLSGASMHHGLRTEALACGHGLPPRKVVALALSQQG